MFIERENFDKYIREFFLEQYFAVANLTPDRRYACIYVDLLYVNREEGQLYDYVVSDFEIKDWKGEGHWGNTYFNFMLDKYGANYYKAFKKVQFTNKHLINTRGVGKRLERERLARIRKNHKQTRLDDPSFYK